MVREINVSAYEHPPPAGQLKERKIGNGPIYDVNEVLSMLDQSDAIRLWTRKCIVDVQRHDLDLPSVAELLRRALHKGKFLGSEWCYSKPDGPVAACDAYSFCTKEWNEASKKELTVEYYLKFAIARTGKLVLVVSCHI